MNTQKIDMEELIESLSMVDGVAGDEENASKLAMHIISPYCESVHMDDFNNVVAVVKTAGLGEKTIMLDAHIDEIGMIVVGIDSNGFIKVENCGGIDRRLILGQEVRIFGTEVIKGIVCTIPPHLTTDDSKIPDMGSISIDIGMTKEEAQSLISLGDRVIIHSEFTKLLGGRVSCKALDDRCCVATIIHAVSNLNVEDLDYGLTVVFSAQEETGEAGSCVATYNVKPDMAIALDVSFALTPDADKYKCGRMSRGAMIGISPILDRKMSYELEKVAKQNNIPYQFEVMGGRTGTNADVISVTREGVRTALLSIPLKYMHTPIEVVEIADCEQTSKLLCAYLTGSKSVQKDETNEKNKAEGGAIDA